VQHVEALPHLAAELLAEQLDNIVFVIDDQNAGFMPPFLTSHVRGVAVAP
jgi:hypothetical protein